MDPYPPPPHFTTLSLRRSRRIASHTIHLTPSSHPASQVPPTAIPERAFALFSKLPLELQIEIWKIAVAADVTVRIQRISPNGNRHFAPSLDYELLSPLQKITILSKAHPVPACLHTCLDSRRVGEKIYSLWPMEKGGFAWVNKHTDIFYLSDFGPRNYWFLYFRVATHIGHEIDPKHRELADLMRHFLGKQLVGVRNIAFKRDNIFGKPYMLDWMMSLPDAVNWTVLIDRDERLGKSSSWVFSPVPNDDRALPRIRAYFEKHIKRSTYERKTPPHIDFVHAIPTVRDYRWSG